MNKPFIIGLAGGSGAGKTTVANLLIKNFQNEILLLSHDRYYRDQTDISLEERRKTNYDHPDSLETNLMLQHVNMLIQGKNIQAPSYDYTIHTRSDKKDTLQPKHIILIEGILILAEKDLRDLMDLKIFIDCESDTRLGRRVKRDMQERDRTLEFALDQYFTKTRPMHDLFVEPSKKYADIIIPWEKYNHSAVNTVIDFIKYRLVNSQS